MGDSGNDFGFLPSSQLSYRDQPTDLQRAFPLHQLFPAALATSGDRECYLVPGPVDFTERQGEGMKALDR